MGATRQMRRQIGSPTPNAERSAARTHRQWPRSSKACQHRHEAILCVQRRVNGGERGGDKGNTAEAAYSQVK